MSDAQTLSEQDYDAALVRVAEYREQLQRADRQADQNSLDRARDLELLYQAMRWVDEVPAPKNKVWRGHPVDPRSRNRFAGWMLQKTGLSPSTVRKLHGAHQIVSELNSCYGVTLNPTGAEATRPLQRLRRAGYGDRIGDVYRSALQLAEGQQPTSAETKQAVRDFLAQFSRAERQHPGERVMTRVLVHGTVYAYKGLGCRCDQCRKAQRDQANRWRKTVKGNPPVHGTANGYFNYACRCGPCKTAGAAYAREYQQRT